MMVTKLLGVSLRPPQIRTSSFRSFTRPSLLLQPLVAWDFVLSWRLVRLEQPRIGFVYLRSSFCLQLPSDSASRLTPLLLANGRRSPAPVRDFHPRDDAHAGRTKKRLDENRQVLILLAERQGFEPWVRYRTPDFESGTIDHSDTSPYLLFVASVAEKLLH